MLPKPPDTGINMLSKASAKPTVLLSTTKSRRPVGCSLEPCGEAGTVLLSWPTLEWEPLYPSAQEKVCRARGHGSASAINCTEPLQKMRHLHEIKMDRPTTILSRWNSSRLVCINILISALFLPLSLQSMVELCFSQKIIHDVYSWCCFSQGAVILRRTEAQGWIPTAGVCQTGRGGCDWWELQAEYEEGAGEVLHYPGRTSSPWASGCSLTERDSTPAKPVLHKETRYRHLTFLIYPKEE